MCKGPYGIAKFTVAFWIGIVSDYNRYVIHDPCFMNMHLFPALDGGT